MSSGTAILPSPNMLDGGQEVCPKGPGAYIGIKLGLGFGVWGLGFGVQGLGFRV